MNWFAVNKDGLRKLIATKPKVFVMHELIQNSLDAGSKNITLKLDPAATRGTYNLAAHDDGTVPWSRMSHAYTLFDNSDKASDPTKRGMFCLGEKLVLAMCREALLCTTKGHVRFGKNGNRSSGPSKATDQGTSFEALIEMTKAEFEQLREDIKRIIIPDGVNVVFNGWKLPTWPVDHTFKSSLPTMKAGKDGGPRATVRKTKVDLHQANEGEQGWLFEMGIPVVEIGGRWHVNVHQKVPLNMQRDNVTPSYRKKMWTIVANFLESLISEEDATGDLGHIALASEDTSPEAVKAILTARFGEKVVAQDIRDPEANKTAVANGYTVVGGGALSKDQWKQAKSAGGVVSAGKLFPSDQDRGGGEHSVIAPSDYTGGMKKVIAFAVDFARELLGVESLGVKVYKSREDNAIARYGPHVGLSFNLQRLGHEWFNSFPSNGEEVIDLLIHEFGHHYEFDHLSDKYYRALTKLGAKSTRLALSNPGLFVQHGLASPNLTLAERM